MTTAKDAHGMDDLDALFAANGFVSKPKVTTAVVAAASTSAGTSKAKGLRERVPLGSAKKTKTRPQSGRKKKKAQRFSAAASVLASMDESLPFGSSTMRTSVAHSKELSFGRHDDTDMDIDFGDVDMDLDMSMADSMSPTSSGTGSGFAFATGSPGDSVGETFVEGDSLISDSQLRIDVDKRRRSLSMAPTPAGATSRLFRGAEAVSPIPQAEPLVNHDDMDVDDDDELDQHLNEVARRQDSKHAKNMIVAGLRRPSRSKTSGRGGTLRERMEKRMAVLRQKQMQQMEASLRKMNGIDEGNEDAYEEDESKMSEVDEEDEDDSIVQPVRNNKRKARASDRGNKAKRPNYFCRLEDKSLPADISDGMSSRSEEPYRPEDSSRMLDETLDVNMSTVSNEDGEDTDDAAGGSSSWAAGNDDADRKTRRGTLQMQQEAREAGLLELLEKQEERAQRVTDARGRPLRRSRRRRMAPLKWWKNEHAVYKRDTSDPVGVFLPTVVGLELAPPSPAPRRRKRKQSKKSKKKDKKRRKKSKKSKHSSSSSSDDTEESAPPVDEDFRTVAKVYDGKADKERVQEVAKASSMVKKTRLEQSAPPGVAPVKKDKLPLVGIAFRRPGYALGSMTIPPGGCKLPEHAWCEEIFTITSAAPRALFVRIGRASWHLSNGACFRVPAANEYELRNESDRPIELQFTMVSKDAQT